MALKKQQPPAELPVRLREEVEVELMENAKRAERYSIADPRWGPLHVFINELLDEWEVSK